MISDCFMKLHSLMDRISAAKRRKNMQHIRSKNTLPEMVVRRLLYSMEYDIDFMMLHFRET